MKTMRQTKALLKKLAGELLVLGFYGYEETIEEWLGDPESETVFKMLSGLGQSVWQDFANVGDVDNEWLDEHPRPDIDSDEYRTQPEFDAADERWRKAWEKEAKKPYVAADKLIFQALEDLRGGERKRGER